ncbi:hypothetical protein TB2_036836 [Malus domestica]
MAARRWIGAPAAALRLLPLYSPSSSSVLLRCCRLVAWSLGTSGGLQKTPWSWTVISYNFGTLSLSLNNGFLNQAIDGRDCL